jgi:glyoxylase-like metal-dependent hydrolase (beta-lactamase superfamily II)/rhodanese-related sulfurtransferase
LNVLLGSFFVLFRQFVGDDLGCASYLIGDETSHEAVVIDPAYAIEQYLEEAEHRRARIVRVLETHTHADHVSGHGRFALEHAVPVSVHPAAEPEFDFEPLEDGQEIVVGDVAIRVLHTPGHRPEHCCFAVVDRSRGDEPWLVITGDSLLIGEAARPDLASEAAEGARGLAASLRRLLEFSDGVEVYPGHVAGSLCGSGMSSKHSSTIGFERSFNHALELAARSEEDFVAEKVGSSAPRPPNMDRIVALNRGAFVAARPALEVAGSASGATVLDVRPTSDFVTGHVEGAFNVPVSGSRFPTKAAFVLTPDEPVVIHAPSEDEAQQAARGLHSVGLFELRGYLTEAESTETMPPVTIDELERLVADHAVEVLDVREKNERDEGYVVGTRHMPYRIVREFADDFNGKRPVVTICTTGARATIAASVLQAAGVEARPVLGGGVEDWAERGGDTVQFRRCGS